MTEGEWEEISLTHRGDSYAIGRWDNTGTFSEIRLSEVNLQSLLPLIQRECARLLESRSTPGLKEQGVEPIVAIPVRSFAVGSDLRRSELFTA